MALPDTEVIRARNRIDAMRQSVGLNPAPQQSWWQTAMDNVGGAISNWWHMYDSPEAQAQAAGTAASAISPALAPMAQAGLNVQAGRVAPQFPVSALNLSSGDSSTTAMGKAALIGAAGPGALFAASVAGYDTGIRGLNTAIGGSALLGNTIISRELGMQDANPLTRDNQSLADWLSDVPATYRMVWGQDEEITDPVTGEKQTVQNSITAGQALSLTIGRNWVGFIDMVTPGNLQEELDKKILEDTATALEDPSNTRGLYSWMSGLYSQFDVSDYQQRESAFNQGAGRWISGTSDAAIQWYLAPDVIALKVAGKAGRSLFMQSIDDLADMNKLEEKLELHRLWMQGDPNGKKTAVGKLVESLTKLDERTVAKHKIATTSTDQALVAHAFGKSKTWEDTADVLLAFSGNKAAIDRILEKDIVTGDILKGAVEDAKRQQDILTFSTKQIEDNMDKAPFGALLHVQRLNSVEEIDRLQKLVDNLMKERADLAAAVSGINKDAGVLREVRLGEMPLSKLAWGPNSVVRMENQAQRAVLKSQGRHLWKEEVFTSGNGFGRRIRVFRSAFDLMKTYRIAGHVNLNDSNEVIAEIESSMQTLPMFRQLMRQGWDAVVPGTDRTAAEFRQFYIDLVTSATNASDRWTALRRYENATWNALAAHYNIHPESAKRIVERYQSLRQGLHDQIRERGWFHDNGDVIIAPELQSLLAENYNIVDFHLIEQLFRIEEGSGVAKVRVGADRSLDWLNSIWRPLVLMRLGYTARNVSEGWLRELAGYGTFGSLYERGLGSANLSQSDKQFMRWAAAWGNRIDRADRLFMSMRTGTLKKLRRNLDAQQAIVYRRAKLVKQSEREHENTLGMITRIADEAHERARRNLTEEAMRSMRESASVNWEHADDIARGRLTEFFDTVDQVYMPAQYIKPFTNAGPGSSRRANVASGFDNMGDAQFASATQNVEPANYRLLNNGVADDYRVSEVTRFLPPGERRELLDLWKPGDWTAEQKARFDELFATATRNSIAFHARKGDRVVRIQRPGFYEIIHDPKSITIKDIQSGNIGLLPKENLEKVQFVRASVSGKVFDLRRPDGPADLAPLRDAMETYTTTPDLLGRTPEEFYAGTGLTETREEALQRMQVEFAELIGDDHRLYIGSDYFWHTAEELVILAESNPEVLEALTVRAWANKLPLDIKVWLKEHGLLIPSQVLKKTLKAARKADRSARKAEVTHAQFREDLLNDLKSDEFLDQLMGTNKGRYTLHAGQQIPDHQLEPTRYNYDTIGMLWGPGFYTTRSTKTAGSYLYNKAIIQDKVSDPTVYMTRIRPGDEKKFLDVDAELSSYEDVDLAMKIIDDMHFHMFGERIDESVDGDAFLDRLAQSLIYSVGQRGASLRGDEELEDILSYATWGDLLKASQKVASDGVSGSLTGRVDATKAWGDAIRGNGFWGIRHVGGNNFQTWDEWINHDVFIWYTQPKLTRVDELSDRAIELLRLEKAAEDLNKLAEDAAYKITNVEDYAPFSARSLDAAHMTPRQMQMLSEYMKREGVGKILVNDSSSPGKYRVITNPDMMEIHGDSLNAVAPGVVAKEQLSDRLLKIYQGQELGDNIMYPWAESHDVLIGELGEEATALARGEIKMKKASPEARARLARYMEVNDLSHVSMGYGDDAKYVSAADLVNKSDVGAAYGALLDADAVTQRANRMLSDDEQFQKLLTIADEQGQEAARGAERLAADQAKAKQISDKLAKRIGKRAAQGKQAKPKMGTGTERIMYRGGSFDAPGVFDPNEQGAMWLERSGADARVGTELYGYTDHQYRNMRRTNIPTPYSPGDSFYWQTMAERVNRQYRNDPIAHAILQGKSDDEIMDILFGTERGRSWLRNSKDFKPFKDYVSRDVLGEGVRAEMVEEIGNRRKVIEDLLPDEEVRAVAGDGDVSPDFLRAQMGWRSDLKTIDGLGVQHQNRGVYKTATGNIMHALGTLPENALVRHPFFRARWREEMTRQANLYYGQGVTEFTPEMINSMSRIARKFALRKTNDTLYTITRMSTPAHALRFVMPFFPAWANAMKYWLKRVPVQQPQNIARYAMAFDSPESAGWVYDDQTGQKVEGADNLPGKIWNKLSGVDNGKIVVQLTPDVAKRLSVLTGGETQITLSKGTLDMMLQGEYFWVPSTGPIVSIPASWLASQMPDVAEAFDSGRITQDISWIPDWPELDGLIAKTELSKAMYHAVVPFGTPTKEKDFYSAAIEGFLPAGAQKFATALRGEGAPEFRSATEAIYRDMSTDYELGLTDKKPNYLDAVAQARTFWIFRGLVNYVAPFAPAFRSKYQFYIDQWRNMNNQIGSTLPDGTTFTYQMAQDQFIQQYGPTFFRYTKSLSGSSSGVSPTMGEFTAALNDKEAVASLANIGEDASFVTMLTRHFADQGPDSFSDAIFSYQTDRPIEGARGKYFRGGNQSGSSEVSAQRELGWYYFRKGEAQWQAAITAAGLKAYDDSPAVDAAHNKWIEELAQKYPAWYDDKLDIGGNRWFQSNQALDIVLNSQTAKAHENDPYFQALAKYRDYRDQFVTILQQRDAQGGSSDLTAKSNADVAYAWTVLMSELKATDSDFEDTYNRFFSSDKLLPNPVRTNG